MVARASCSYHTCISAFCILQPLLTINVQTLAARCGCVNWGSHGVWAADSCIPLILRSPCVLGCKPPNYTYHTCSPRTTTAGNTRSVRACVRTCVCVCLLACACLRARATAGNAACMRNLVIGIVGVAAYQHSGLGRMCCVCVCVTVCTRPQASDWVLVRMRACVRASVCSCGRVGGLGGCAWSCAPL